MDPLLHPFLTLEVLLALLGSTKAHGHHFIHEIMKQDFIRIHSSKKVVLFCTLVCLLTKSWM